ncbi:protein kinase domain-containing protein [Acinetobacter sp. AND/436]|uniref:protein kinase domain-containing protein n=1 Tax=Acinetobacter sp. AND/436 TaxID=3414736 RepID=UPI003C2C1749
MNTPNPNLLPFSPAELEHYCFELKTKPQSFKMGRRLFQFQQGQSVYWLKAQQRDAHPQLSAGFCRELDFYRQFQQADAPDFLLPFYCSQNTEMLCIQQETFQDYLIVPDAPALFALAPSQFSLSQIQTRLLQVLDSLEQLTRLGYLHADLKAEHWREWAGQVKLIDFEQLQAIDDPLMSNMTATPRYMAPELFHGEAKTLASDLYALGIIIYEWLTQRRLQAKSYQDWAYLHCQQLKIELPAAYLGFQDLLEVMLNKQKSQREVSFFALKTLLSTENA